MSTDTSAFDDDPRFKEYLVGERYARRAQRIVKSEEAQTLWVSPPWPATLAAQLAEGVPEIDWVIQDFAPAGIIQVNAQWKSGKTTLLMNSAAALVTGEAFLGRFEVNFGADECVGFLNMELSKRQMLRWWGDMALPPEAMQRIRVYHAREHGFGALDLSNELAVEWLIEWFRDHQVTYAMWDPLAKLFNPASWGGGDPNSAYNAFWVVLEHIMREAGLRGMLIAHHTGFNVEAADRARGASAMMDCPDVNISYRLGDDEHGLPDPKGPRYLKALGRDVELEEFEVGYTDHLRALYATGQGKRTDAQVFHLANELYSTVCALSDGRNDDELPNKTTVFGELGWPMSGRAAEPCNSAYKLALKRNWVAVLRKGSSKLHRPGPERPDNLRKQGITGDADEA